MSWGAARRPRPGQISILPANQPYSVGVCAAGGSVVVSLEQKLLSYAAAEQGVFGNVEPVWVDTITGGIYELPRKKMIVEGEKLVFKDVPLYDAPTMPADAVGEGDLRA